MIKFLKAADGRTVDQEDGSPWPIEGMDAPDTLFIRRRLRDGDLIEAEPPAAAEPIPEPPQPEPEAAPETRPKRK